MTLHFGFDRQGGFAAIDTATHASAYAYPTSTNASKAHASPQCCAARMVNSAIGNRECVSPALWEECYKLLAEKLQVSA
jgi:D-arabinose 1-dehydrogenase-like Zn-dependent alcohol dehydrogenase